MHQKGNIHGAKNEHPLAIEAYIITLRIYKQHYGDSHLSVANSLFNLGVSLNAKGSPEKGLKCFFKALRISKAELGEDHLDVADTYEQMAFCHKTMMNYTEAIEYFEKALNARKHLGSSELKSAAIMHDMGKVYTQMNDKQKSAEKAFKESLRIRSLKLSQDNVLIAETMFQLGSLYKDQDDMLSALKYYEESLRINKMHFNTPKSLLADIFYSLGDIHNSLGNKDKSLFCYNKAMSMYSEEYGPKCKNVVSCLARKGRLLFVSGENANALSCFAECLDCTRLLTAESEQSSLAEDRAYALHQLGEIYSRMNNAAEASSHFSLALSSYKKLGQNHAVAALLETMATHYVKNKEMERGYSCAKEALIVKVELYGPDDTETADSHYFMAKILYECSKFNEAMEFVEKALSVHLKVGRMSKQVADENFLLGAILEQKADMSGNPQEESQNNLDSAVQHLQDALTAQRELQLGDNPGLISTTLTRLGHVYYKLEDYDNAINAFSEALKIRETNRGSNSSTHLLVADSLFDLGAALNKSLDTKRSLQLFTDALREYQVALDKNHLNIAKCLGSIGEVHEKENQLPEAISYLKKAVTIYEYNFGTGEPNEKAMKASSNRADYAHQAETLMALATSYDRMGDDASSLKLYRQTLKIYKALFGRDSLQVAQVLNCVANIKGKTGSVEKAMVLFDESLRIRMLHLGNNHESVAETLFGMVSVFVLKSKLLSSMKFVTYALILDTVLQ